MTHGWMDTVIVCGGVAKVIYLLDIVLRWKYFQSVKESSTDVK